MTDDGNIKKILIQAIPNSRASEIKELTQNIFKVKLTSPPIGGQANRELIKLLAKYFKVHRTNVIILKGVTSRQKIIQISLND